MIRCWSCFSLLLVAHLWIGQDSLLLLALLWTLNRLLFGGIELGKLCESWLAQWCNAWQLLLSQIRLLNLLKVDWVGAGLFQTLWIIYHLAVVKHALTFVRTRTWPFFLYIAECLSSIFREQTAHVWQVGRQCSELLTGLLVLAGSRDLRTLSQDYLIELDQAFLAVKILLASLWDPWSQVHTLGCSYRAVLSWTWGDYILSLVENASFWPILGDGNTAKFARILLLRHQFRFCCKSNDACLISIE